MASSGPGKSSSQWKVNRKGQDEVLFNQSFQQDTIASVSCARVNLGGGPLSNERWDQRKGVDMAMSRHKVQTAETFVGD